MGGSQILAQISPQRPQIFSPAAGLWADGALAVGWWPHQVGFQIKYLHFHYFMCCRGGPMPITSNTGHTYQSIRSHSLRHRRRVSTARVLSFQFAV